MASDLAPALAQATRRQSRTARELGGVCCAWLPLFSGGVLLGLKHFGAPSTRERWPSARRRL
jgi:hypothetical protein